MRVKRRMGEREVDLGVSDDGFFKKGTWTPEEDALLLAFVEEHGAAAWNMARSYYPALRRTGKSCRLRYLNQLRPGIRRQSISPQEERYILQAHAIFGNQWSKIASLLQGRTDNTVKNVVNMRLKKARRRAASLNFARAAARMLSPLSVNVSSGLGQCSYSPPGTTSSMPLHGGSDHSEAITAETMLMLSAISYLYPPDASSCGQSSAFTDNWAALQQGQLPSVQDQYQCLSVGSELPSVQCHCNSLGGSERALKLPSVQDQSPSFESNMSEVAASIISSYINGAHKLPSVQEQSTSFDSNMSELSASISSLIINGAHELPSVQEQSTSVESNMSEAAGSFGSFSKATATGDKDLLEAVYASGSVTFNRSANSRNSHVTNDMSLNAIPKDLRLTGVQVNEDMEYAYDSLQAEEVLNHPGIMQGLYSMIGTDLASMIGGSTWGTMPAARDVDDPDFQ